MLHLTRLARDAHTPTGVLTLVYDVRQKSRFRARLDDGRDVLVQLPRGTVLCDGDVLEGDGASVRVCAAPEPVSVASAADPLLVLRAAYHLGNRHVPLQITLERLIYQTDHVLDAMLRDLGLDVRAARLEFQPERGAYAHGAAPAGHAHEHDHDHEH